MKDVNTVKNLKYRIVDDNIVEFDVIHASPTLIRQDKTFGFSFIELDKNLNTFIENFETEKRRIQNSTNLFPPKNNVDCVHCSAMPWLNFVSHKEPLSGVKDATKNSV